jgi:hypothetical protein
MGIVGQGQQISVRRFYAKYLPIGDRLGETFYAIWMVVISLGLLGATGLEKESIAYAIFVAFLVNMTWGAIDGVTVMMSKVIDRAKNEQLVYDLRTKKDKASRDAIFNGLDGTVVDDLGPADRQKVIDLIVAGEPGKDPANKRYYADRDEWFYAIGIFLIDLVMVVPIVVPLVIISDPVAALYTSQLVATIFFAALGVAYAKNLHRRKWVAALLLGTLCFSIFTMAFYWGW